MRPALASTSVPTWATTAERPDADLSGRYWTVVAIGADADIMSEQWAAQIAAHAPDADIRIHRVDDDDAAVAAVTADLVDAVVGWRLMVAGPAHACLRLRAHAMQCGAADDEITVASTAVTTRDVRCAFCATVTRGEMDLGDELSCSGCGRTVVVHHHVSRRLGTHLGLLVDPGDTAGSVDS
jgi:dimethylamine monooxygenase subunit C